MLLKRSYGIYTAILMRVMPELRPKLFADEVGFQSSRIATLSGKIPAAPFRQSILNGLRLFGKDVAGCSGDTLKVFPDDAVNVGCLQ